MYIFLVKVSDKNWLTNIFEVMNGIFIAIQISHATDSIEKAIKAHQSRHLDSKMPYDHIRDSKQRIQIFSNRRLEETYLNKMAKDGIRTAVEQFTGALCQIVNRNENNPERNIDDAERDTKIKIVTISMGAKASFVMPPQPKIDVNIMGKVTIGEKGWLQEDFIYIS